MEIKPSQDLVDEVAKQKKEESESINTSPVNDDTQSKDSMSSNEASAPIRKPVDVSSIYPDPNNPKPTLKESDEREEQDDKDSSSKPISLQIPSLFILALVGVVLQAANVYSSIKLYSKDHQNVHLSLVILLPLLIKAVGLILSLYLLLGRVRENILTILNIYLVLLVFVLILTLLAGSLWLWILIVLDVLYIAFIVHVKNKVREAELK